MGCPNGSQTKGMVEGLFYCPQINRFVNVKGGKCIKSNCTQKTTKKKGKKK